MDYQIMYMFVVVGPRASISLHIDEAKGMLLCATPFYDCQVDLISFQVSAELLCWSAIGYATVKIQSRSQSDRCEPLDLLIYRLLIISCSGPS